jgi:hypothetical protein
MNNLSSSPTARFFGIPVGDFGPFATVLISASIGALTFFIATFLSIFGIVIYNAFGHHVDFNVSYRWIALPAGVLMLLVSLTYLGSLWIRRKSRGE